MGDIILVKPGGSIPVDGIIIEGKSSIDESSITGESIPVLKNVGDQVISGTINKNGFFKMRATKVGENTTLSQIIKLVEEAGNSKAPISRLADKVSAIFVPVVIGIAVIATIFWLFNGQSIEFALSIGISILVISCPCALGLATPVAIMVGTGKAAENGILIKDAESLENLHSVNTVVMDKTGTITEGRPEVVGIETTIDEKYFLQIIGSLEKKSEHPLSDAILKKCQEENVELLEVKQFDSITGRGLKGIIEDRKYFAGNFAFMTENNIKTIEVNDCQTVIYVSDEKNIIGKVQIQDIVKPDSKCAIGLLKKKNINVMMVTGDNRKVAEKIGSEIEINDIISEVLPQEKLKVIEDIQKNGEKVAFIGDGINDSPALTQADIGIAIGSGTDIAIESANIVLIKNNLMDVVNAINLSQNVIKNIKLSLFWAFIYNIIGIPIAAGLFYFSYGLKLNPMIAATAMSLSSVSVVTNALRLRNIKLKHNYNNLCSIDKNINKEEKNMKKVINIEGMQCNHCKMSVEKALSSIDGVKNVEVSLENKNALIESDIQIDDSIIKKAIEEAGFEVK